jgi:hypothetical protein
VQPAAFLFCPWRIRTICALDDTVFTRLKPDSKAGTLALEKILAMWKSAKTFIVRFVPLPGGPQPTHPDITTFPAFLSANMKSAPISPDSIMLPA